MKKCFHVWCLRWCKRNHKEYNDRKDAILCSSNWPTLFVSKLWIFETVIMATNWTTFICAVLQA